MDPSDSPKLRPLDITPYEQEGKPFLVLRDPINVSPQTLLVPQGALLILQLMDGEHSLRDIQAEYASRLGVLVMTEDLQALTKKLDAALMLEGPAHEEARGRALESYGKLRVRPPAHAGIAYDGQAEAARERLDGFFTADGAPGAIVEELVECPLTEGQDICGLVAPHIDPIRGATCYAWAYKTLAEQSAADLFVVLGTAHQQSQNLYLPCDMAFSTPLGVVEADHDFMAQLQQRCPIDLGVDLLVHRIEHSLEFQALFLSYCFDGRREITMAPILCSSLLQYVAPDEDPMAVPVVRDFIEALRETLASCGRKVCLLAGVDLAHVGPKFGHETLVRPSDLPDIAADDREMLDLVIALDGPGFFKSIRGDGDSRNVCGFTGIYTLLQVAGAERAELLNYGQAHEPDTNSAVTFASVILTRERVDAP